MIVSAGIQKRTRRKNNGHDTRQKVTTKLQKGATNCAKKGLLNRKIKRPVYTKRRGIREDSTEPVTEDCVT